MKFFKKTLSTLLVAGLLLGNTLSVFANEPIVINVISFNDFHGALLAPSETDRNIGAAKFVTAIKEEMAKNPNTLVVAGGDNYNGSAISNLLYGKPVSDMFKEIGVFASAIGNHEFDWGAEKIPTWANDSGTPFVSANIVYKGTKDIVSFATPYIITEVEGVNVAFLGLTTQETYYKTNPVFIGGFDFLDPVEVTREYIPLIREEGADIIILLAHIGSEQNGDEVSLFEAEELPFIDGVDAIITGHTHRNVAGFINNVPVVQAAYNGRGFTNIEFVVDALTKEIISATPTVEVLFERKAELAEDPAMAAIMAAHQATVGPILEEVIGNTQFGLNHARRTGQTQLGQWGAEQMRLAGSAQIAFQNDGGIRTTIEPGEITTAKLYEVMPFDNVLSILNMTGAGVRAILEHGIENAEIGPVQMSGFEKVEYTTDADGNNVILKMVLLGGIEVEDDAVYRVVTNDFMANGGDAYNAFLDAEFVAETLVIRDIWIDAIRAEEFTDHELEDVVVFVEPDAVPTVETTQPTSETTNPEEEKVTPETKALPTDTTTYTVVSGDSLYRIARNLLGSGNLWSKIFEANKNIIQNPDRIFIGQELVIPK